MDFSSSREEIANLVIEMQSNAERNFIEAFIAKYGNVELAEDIANEFFGNQAGFTQKIFDMLAIYDRKKSNYPSMNDFISKFPIDEMLVLKKATEILW